MIWLSIAITVAAALIGFFSKSWDASKKGAKKLSIIGWVSLFLLLGGFTITVLTTYKNQTDNAKHVWEQKKLQFIVCERVIYACEQEARFFINTLGLSCRNGNWPEYINNIEFYDDLRPQMDSLTENGFKFLYLTKGEKAIHNFRFFDDNYEFNFSREKNLVLYIYDPMRITYEAHDELRRSPTNLSKVNESFKQNFAISQQILLDSILSHPFYSSLDDFMHRFEKNRLIHEEAEFLPEHSESAQLYFRLIHRLWLESNKKRKSLRDELKDLNLPINGSNSVPGGSLHGTSLKTIDLSHFFYLVIYCCS